MSKKRRILKKIDMIKLLEAQVAEKNALITAKDKLIVEERARTLEERAAREKMALTAFFNKFVGMGSADAAETKAGTDTSRRGAPQLKELHGKDKLLGLGLPPLDSNGRRFVASSWESFKINQQAAVEAPLAAGVKGEFKERYEDKLVHPTMKRVMEAAVQAVHSIQPAAAVRLWHKTLCADPIPNAEIIPDFSCTHAREGSLSLHASFFRLELKLRCDMKGAVDQAYAYGRRRNLHMFEDEVARGTPAHAANMATLAAGSDGLKIAFLRVNTGVPATGTFEGATPCSPTLTSGPLPLLSAWEDGVAPIVPADAPSGFKALVRALLAAAAPPFAVTAPLEELRVSWTDEPLKLGNRMGCGGSADVYATDDNAVVKVARAATKHRVNSFRVEAEALTALSSASASAGMLWPKLVCEGTRVSVDLRPDMKSLACPVLKLRPLAQTLQAWVNARLVAASGTEPGIVRRQCANVATIRILLALKSAHDAGWVHGDVRPPNVVVVATTTGNGVLLSDWGCAQKVNLAHKMGAAAALADVQAAACLWLSIAYGTECQAPWAADSRSMWLGTHSELPCVAAISQWIQQTDRQYSLPRCHFGSSATVLPASELSAAPAAARTAFAAARR